MTVTQYVGARYVPDFAQPIEWNNTRTYEPLTIVTHQGNSYTSRQFVPLGIDIENETFWALTGNYNAQVEQYREEVMKFYNDVNNLTHSLVGTNVLEYGADNTGNKDCSNEVQTAINETPKNGYISFPTGVYKLHDIELKSNITYDFRNSEIILTGGGFTLNGKLIKTSSLLDDYNAMQTSISIDNVSEGDIIIIQNDTERTFYDRSYYYKGFTCKALKVNNNISITPSCPVSINSNGSIVNVYEPATAKIMNISNIHFSENVMSNMDIFTFNYCSGICVENIYSDTICSHGLNFHWCIDCSVHNFNGSFRRLTNDSNSYPISINESSYITIENCNIVSQWHCISGEGFHFNLHTKISDCNLITLETSYAYFDHSNSLYTYIDNCYLAPGAGVSCGGSVTNCMIANTSYKNGGFSSIGFRCASEPMRSIADYTFENLTFVLDYNNIDRNNVGISSLYSDTTGQTELKSYVKNLTIRNCKSKYNLPLFLSKYDTKPLFENVLIDNSNLYILQIVEAYGDIDNLTYINNVYDTDNFTGGYYRMPIAVAGDNKNIKKCFIDNCTFHSNSANIVYLPNSLVVVNNTTIHKHNNRYGKFIAKTIYMSNCIQINDSNVSGYIVSEGELYVSSSEINVNLNSVRTHGIFKSVNNPWDSLCMHDTSNHYYRVIIENETLKIIETIIDNA